jgi:MYXO-CTERM domain-containing protein
MLMMGMVTKGPIERPPSIGHVDSRTHPVRCHWEHAEHAYQCDEIIPAIEEAWDVQVGELGWPAPIPDGNGILDIYVATTGSTGGAYTYGPYKDQDWGDGRLGTYSYIALDPTYDTWIRWTMLHEFNHVLQFGIDVAEPRYVPWEGTATAAEFWTDPLLSPLAEYITDFQDAPFVGLLGDGWWLWDEHEIWSYYEYGASLWLLHMDAWYGDGAGSAGLDLWMNGIQDSWTNEPDFIDASGEFTGDWASAWMDFSVERARIGTPHAPEWALEWTEPEFAIGVEDLFDVSELPIDHRPVISPLQTGAVYLEISGLSEGQQFTIAHDGDEGVRWALLVVDGEDGDWVEADSLTWEAVEQTVVVGLVNLGSGRFDADDRVQGSDAILYVALGADAGGGGGKPGGCGCSTAGGGQGGWALLALLGLPWARRRSWPSLSRSPRASSGGPAGA